MIKVLILEDNRKVLEVIGEGLKELEKELGEIESLNFREGKKAREFVQKNSLEEFDVILLDRISQDAMTFHEAVLDQTRPKKIIAISNTPAYNALAEERGVSRTVQKNYFDLNRFKDDLKKEIKNIINFKQPS